MTNTIVLDFLGPFTWTASKEDESSALYSKISQKHGMYLWTIKTDEGYLIYYIGITQQGFGSRMKTHLEKQLTGQYSIYLPEELKEGKRGPVAWRGIFGASEKKVIPQYLEKLPALLPAQLEYIRAVQFFLAPSDISKRQLERIEAALQRCLIDQGGMIGDAVERFNVSSTRKGEEPMEVEIRCKSKLIGVPDILHVTPKG